MVKIYGSSKRKKKGKEAYSSLCYKHRTATGTHVPYGITQYYLPPSRGDTPAFTPANLAVVVVVVAVIVHQSESGRFR